MNIDKFKDLKPVNHRFDITDVEYVNKLNALPKRQPKKQVWAVVGTVAAAVAIVSVVALWALIGRGIRGTQVPHEQLLYPAGEVSVELTDDMQQKFDMMYHNSRLFALPIFKEGESISQKAFSDYVYYIETDAKSDWVITASELNDLYFDTFGQKSEFTSGINYDEPYTVNVSLVGQKLLSFTRSFLPEETQKITLTYGEPDVSVTTLTYIAKVGFDFEPDYFVTHTATNTVFIKETASHYVNEIVYKVTGDNADTLLDIVRNAVKTKDSDVCYCCPNYRIVYNGIEYSVVMGGDKNMAHIVYTEGLGETFNHRLTEDEYERLEKALAEYAVESNFVEKKDYEPQYSPQETEVKIVVDDICEQYNAGTYVIPGDDAKLLMRRLDSKRYVYDQVKLDTGISIQVGDKYYSLNVGDEPFIQNRCGRCPIEKDDPIIERIDRYLKSGDIPVGTIIETGHVTYDESEFITKEKVVSIAVEEAKKDKYDYQGWDSDFYFNDSSNEPKRVSTAGDWLEGYWREDWQTEHYSKNEQICWRIRLFDKNDPLTSLIMYIDAETGNVIGASELSD